MASMLQVLTVCARLNSILANDSKRLTFIQHDIIEWIASQEGRQHRQCTRNGPRMSRTTSASSGKESCGSAESEIYLWEGPSAHQIAEESVGDLDPRNIGLDSLALGDPLLFGSQDDSDDEPRQARS